MSVSVSENSLEDVKKKEKKLVLTNTKGRKWEASFVGNITRRDFQAIKRVMTVEFAREQRKRSVEHVMRRHRAEKNEEVEKTVKTETKTVKTDPNPKTLMKTETKSSG